MNTQPNFRTDIAAEETIEATNINSETATGNQPANDSIVAYQEPANLYYPQGPFNKMAANKLMMRKRKRSRHPLRDLRLQRGYTLEELAELTKLSPSYLSRLESGTRRLNADILQRIATVLACHPGDLLPTDGNLGKYSLMTHRASSEPHEGPEGYVGPRYPVQDLPLYQLRTSPEQMKLIDLDTPSGLIARPVELQGVAGAISVTMNDNACAPRYKSGDRVFANPVRPLSPNCAVLAITYDNEVVVGEFAGWSTSNDENADKIMIRVNKPSEGPERFTTSQVFFANEKIKAMYRIVGMMEAA